MLLNKWIKSKRQVGPISFIRHRELVLCLPHRGNEFTVFMYHVGDFDKSHAKFQQLAR